MNRWTGTGHLTKDPKFLETENGTAICTLRIAVKRAGKQGHDGYFDVKCFDAQAVGVRAVPQGRARDRRRRPPAVRRVPDPGRQLRLPDLHRRRARRVPRQPQALQRSGQRRGLPRPARHGRRGARGPPGRLTTIAGPRRSTGRGPDDFHVTAMTTTTTTRHETATRFLAALAGTAGRGELLELRYRLEDGQRMGQVFDRPDRLRGLATRAIALGRRTDVYVGCAPRTRRHGGRDAVDRAFVLWADCDGEDAVAALAEFEPAPAIVIASGSGANCHAYWPLTEPLRARRASSARTGASRTRSAPTPRPRTPRGSCGSPGRCRTSTTRRPRSTRSGSTPTGASTPPTSSGRCPTRRRRRPRGRRSCPSQHRGDDPLLAIAPDVYVRRLLGVDVPRHRKVPCPFHEDRHASLHVYETAERGWYCFGACRRGGTIYDLAAPLYGYTARGEDFLRLRAELRRLFGLEAA